MINQSLDGKLISEGDMSKYFSIAPALGYAVKEQLISFDNARSTLDNDLYLMDLRQEKGSMQAGHAQIGLIDNMVYNKGMAGLLYIKGLAENSLVSKY